MLIPWCGRRNWTTRKFKSTILFLGVTSVMTVVVSHFSLKSHVKFRLYEKGDERGNDRTAMLKDDMVRVAGPGENIQVGELEVHVMSAIHRQDYPLPGAFNVLLVGWADKESRNQSFVCCLGNAMNAGNMIEAEAKLLYFDNRVHVEMHPALFVCTLANTSSALDLRYVAFAEKSCDVNMTRGLDITLPKDGTNKIGICAKMAYGDLDPELLVEWFEFAKLVGVDVVQVFYHIVSERAMDVFRYYENTGFVVLLPITLAVKKGSSPRVYGTSEGEVPRGTVVKLWMDGKVTLNDCWHRLSRYDFVVIMDFDELLLPSLPHKTLLEVFQAAVQQKPSAAGFYIESHIVLLDWPASNNQSSIFFLRHLEHTVSDKLDNKGFGKSSPKTVFLPQRVWQVSSHVLRPLQNYKRECLPKDSHKFLHYRHCKTTLWPNCDMERVSDDDILRFETDWLRAVRLSRFRLNQRGFVKQAVSTAGNSSFKDSDP